MVNTFDDDLPHADNTTPSAADARTPDDSDPRDAALAALCPVIGAPRFGALPPMEIGRRLILARNGVFMQTRRRWLDCTKRVGVLDPRARISYGIVNEALSFAFTFDTSLFEPFLDTAREALPNEVAGAVLWDGDTGALRLVMHESLSARPDHVVYRIAEMRPSEELVIDIHSHGYGGAFFSSTDDRDDRDTKLALVFGNVGDAMPSAAARLCIGGHFYPMRDRWSARRKAAHCSGCTNDATGDTGFLEDRGEQP